MKQLIFVSLILFHSNYIHAEDDLPFDGSTFFERDANNSIMRTRNLVKRPDLTDEALLGKYQKTNMMVNLACFTSPFSIPVNAGFGLGVGIADELIDIGQVAGFYKREEDSVGLIEGTVEGALLLPKACKTHIIEKQILRREVERRGISLKKGRNKGRPKLESIIDNKNRSTFDHPNPVTEFEPQASKATTERSLATE